jgi:hypothetical protein
MMRFDAKRRDVLSRARIALALVLFMVSRAAFGQALPGADSPSRAVPGRTALPAPGAPRSSRLPVFSGSVDYFNWVVAPTSRFIDRSSPPWPLHVAVLSVSDDQARLTDPITGLPQGPTKLRQILARFRQHTPQAVTGTYLSAVAVGTRTMITDRKSWPAPLLETRAAYRSFEIIPPLSAACYATINLDSAQGRHVWAHEVSTELLARRKAFGFQLAYLDEMAHPSVAPHGFRWANSCDFLKQVRRRLHADGMALGINVSLPLRGEIQGDLDLLLESVDFISLEAYGSREVCMEEWFPQIIKNLRYLLRAGLPVGLIPVVDPVENRRGRRVVSIGNSPDSGLRVTCDARHWLEDTATKAVRLKQVHADLDDKDWPATVVSETVFDLPDAPQLGAMQPGADAMVWFLFSDQEPTAALMLIAKSTAQERGYVYATPGSDQPWTRWPKTKGVRTSDYTIREMDGKKVKLVTCDFQAERMFVDLQERRVWFEPLKAGGK